jgi:hypothetical protein
MRRAVAFGVLSLLVPAAATAHQGAPYWSLAKVMARIDGARLATPRRPVRVDISTTLCSGIGNSIRRGGVRRWRHFDCTYTTFRRGAVGPDVAFRVHVVGATRFLITNGRWIEP